MRERMVIDGSQGEGGGQVLRTALALAALLQRPLALHEIRAGRKKPGLRPQHLAAVRALARITGAELAGDRESSTALTFNPGPIRGGHYHFRIATAGSVTLLAATLIPPLLFADRPSTVRLEGGTHVPLSPVFHYLDEIFLPCLRRMGAQVEASLERWGWYPAGGGACTLRISPLRSLRPLWVPRRGRLQRLTLTLGLAGLPPHIVEREEAWVRRLLAEDGQTCDSRFLAAPSPGPGNLLFLKGEFEEGLAGFSALGQKGKPAEAVAAELCRDWRAFAESGGALDQHLADQLLLYLALAAGESCFTTEAITSHLETNLALLAAFLPVRFRLDRAARALAVTGVAHAAGSEPGR